VNGTASFVKLMSGVTQGSAVSIQVLRDGKETTIGREATTNGGRFVQMGTKIGKQARSLFRDAQAALGEISAYYRSKAL
jgi:hypothetical protein